MLDKHWNLEKPISCNYRTFWACFLLGVSSEAWRCPLHTFQYCVTCSAVSNIGRIISVRLGGEATYTSVELILEVIISLPFVQTSTRLTSPELREVASHADCRVISRHQYVYLEWPDIKTSILGTSHHGWATNYYVVTESERRQAGTVRPHSSHITTRHKSTHDPCPHSVWSSCNLQTRTEARKLSDGVWRALLGYCVIWSQDFISSQSVCLLVLETNKSIESVRVILSDTFYR